jgi:hypothetical protein
MLASECSRSSVPSGVLRAPVSHPVVNLAPQLALTFEESLLERVDPVEARRLGGLRTKGSRHLGSFEADSIADERRRACALVHTRWRLCSGVPLSTHRQPGREAYSA